MKDKQRWAIQAGIEALNALKWNKVKWMRENSREDFGKVWDAELENIKDIEFSIKVLEQLVQEKQS
jgi:hypothetical protein